MKKRLFALMLALCMVLALAACGGGAGSSSAASGAGGSASASDGGNAGGDSDFFVAYLAKNTVDNFHATLNQTAQTLLDGYVADGTIGKWQLFDGLSDPITQNNLLEDAINMGADAVILLPAEAAGSAPILERCAEENIPCIVINSKTDNTDELATAFVGSNDVQAGEMMAEYVMSQFPDGGSFCHVQGVIGNSAQIERSEGIANIMGAAENWTMLDEQTGEWQAERAVRFAEDWLARFGDDLNAIICEDDGSSAAVQAAMNAAGREDIVCIGVNGEAAALAMIEAGEMLATIYQDGVGQVTAGVNLAIDALLGGEVPATTMIDFVLITADNVGDYI